MTRIINYDEAARLLKEQVQKRGSDYVYTPVTVLDDEGYVEDESCMYFNPEDGSPSCIVGHVVADLGLTLDTLVEVATERYSGASAQYLNNGAIADTLTGALMETERLDLYFTPSAEKLLRRAQSNQDAGHSWGWAVQRALDSVDNEE